MIGERRGRPVRPLLDVPIRLISIADGPRDEDDLRRRKRVGVVAGYMTIVAPLTLPLQVPGQSIAFVIGLALSAYAALNLVVLARTKQFERFVFALILAGVVFVPTASFLGGGITGPTIGLVWAFLVPAYAILALGPRRATPWFVVYLALVAFMVAIDPLARAWTGPASVTSRIIGLVHNTAMPLAITFLLLRYTDLRRLAAEARVDELLTNAIPATIAARLRRGEKRIADSYPATTVLFADIVGFTSWAQRTAPGRVVEVLDALFSAFDDLTGQRGLEKIKTIGDAYMVVAGAPTPRLDHAQAAVALAGDFLTATADVRARLGVDLQVRIGLASGPVIGGVIGERRVLFDLWGDTVNLAQRMEASGIPGRIQIAASTRALLGVEFLTDPRPIEVKGFGRQTAYLVS